MSNSLFQEFEVSDAAAWKAKLEKDLKGTGFDDLRSRDKNGLTILPFYTKEDSVNFSGPLFGHADWTICAAAKTSDNIAEQNAGLLQALQTGAEGIVVNLTAAEDFKALFKDIDLSIIYARISLDNAAIAQALMSAPLHESTTLSFDACAYAAQGGTIDQSRFSDAITLYKETKTIAVEGAFMQQAGANSVTQIAEILAACAEYFNGMTEAEIKELKKLDVGVACGTDFFEELAKLRALRVCLQNLCSAFGADVAIHIFAETSDVYRARVDVYTNLLRDTISGMAAILGGCDALLIHPLSATEQQAERLSRNQQLILKEEVHLNQIADAAYGSFYVDRLTRELAEKGWTAFKEIEAAGGLFAVLGNGSLAKQVEEQAAALTADYTSGKRVLIGVNKYANPADAPVRKSSEIDRAGAFAPLSLADELMKNMPA